MKPYDYIQFALAGIGLLTAAAVIWTRPQPTPLTFSRLNAAYQSYVPPEPIGEVPLLRTVFTIDLPDYSRPLLVTALGAPTCRVAVADAARLAVHVFRLNGQPVGVFRGESRAPRLLESISSIALLPSGRIAVGDAFTGRILVLSVRELTTVEWEIELRREHAEYGPVGLAALQDGSIAVMMRLQSADFVSAGSPIRLLSKEGREYGSYGTRTPLPSGPFTASLTHGSIASLGDTVFLAYSRTAKILAYAQSRQLRGISLPHLFKPAPPRFVMPSASDISNEIRMVDAPQHLGQLTIDRRGSVFVVQEVVSRSMGRERPDSSENVIAILEPGASRPRYVRLGGRVRSISAASHWIYAVTEYPSDDPNAPLRRVIAVRNPLAPSTDNEGQGKC